MQSCLIFPGNLAVIININEGVLISNMFNLVVFVMALNIISDLVVINIINIIVFTFVLFYFYYFNIWGGILRMRELLRLPYMCHG